MGSLNTLKPAPGSKKNPKRRGRGMGSTDGKTAGAGHKGQHARAGGYHKLGFEGGQMPLQRRLPKFGFKSAKLRKTAEIRLSELVDFGHDQVNLSSLRDANLISNNIEHVRIIHAKVELTQALIIGADVKITKGAKEAILQAGGKVES